MRPRATASCGCSNSNISEYKQAGRYNHEPKRPRKLLLHQRQINKLIGAVERERA